MRLSGRTPKKNDFSPPTVKLVGPSGDISPKKSL